MGRITRCISGDNLRRSRSKKRGLHDKNFYDSGRRGRGYSWILSAVTILDHFFESTNDFGGFIFLVAIPCGMLLTIRFSDRVWYQGESREIPRGSRRSLAEFSGMRRHLITVLLCCVLSSPSVADQTWALALEWPWTVESVKQAALGGQSLRYQVSGKFWGRKVAKVEDILILHEDTYHKRLVSLVEDHGEIDPDDIVAALDWTPDGLVTCAFLNDTQPKLIRVETIEVPAGRFTCIKAEFSRDLKDFTVWAIIDRPGVYAKIIESCEAAPAGLTYELVQDLNVKASFNNSLNSAKAGSIHAMYEVAEKFDYGLGVKTDDKAAFNWYKRAAELGSREAICDLGTMHRYGEGTPKSEQQAIICYKRAAELGSPWAQFYLGRILQASGVDQDEVEAFMLFKAAAKQENPNAMVELGRCYEWGLGVSKDRLKALELFKKATLLGNTDAALAGAQACEKRDKALGYWFHQKAFDLGHFPSCAPLAEMYRDGEFAKRDYKLAKSLYEFGAKYHYHECEYGLAEIYERGLGVPKDLELAIQWYRRASMSGAPYADNQLERLGVLKN